MICFGGQELGQELFQVKDRTYIVESTSLIFFPMARLERFFPSVFAV